MSLRRKWSTSSTFRQLTSGDIAKFLIDNINQEHENQTVAKYFGVDIGAGTRSKNKTHEQLCAYDKIYRNFGTARRLVKRRLDGTWKERKVGVKNQRKKYGFIKNEIGA